LESKHAIALTTRERVVRILVVSQVA